MSAGLSGKSSILPPAALLLFAIRISGLDEAEELASVAAQEDGTRKPAREAVLNDLDFSGIITRAVALGPGGSLDDIRGTGIAGAREVHVSVGTVRAQDR